MQLVIWCVKFGRKCLGGGLLEPAFGIYVTQGHGVVGHYYNLCNLSQADDVVS